MWNFAKKFFNFLPENLKSNLRESRAKIPWTIVAQQRKWVRDVYFEFGQQQRRSIFLSIARFQHINRPIPGYYFEFGCNEANTMRMAWDSFHHLFDFTYVGFDSFEGLPEITQIDQQDIWAKGKLAFAEKRFVERVVSHGVPAEKLKTVVGFYDRSLTKDLAQNFLPKKAAVIYIDCDLYASTVSVLHWIPPFLQIGTVIVFDDWNCFSADPNRGERRAWNEFLQANKNLRFEPFISTAEAQAFIFVGSNETVAI
jgi:O-methyltransferase